MKVRTKVRILSGSIVLVALITSVLLRFVFRKLDEEVQILSDKDPSRLPDDPAVLKGVLQSLLEFFRAFRDGYILMIGDLAWVGVFVLVASGMIFYFAGRIDS